MSAYLFSSLVIVSRWVENNTRVGPKEGWQTDFNLSNRIFESGTPDEAESQFRASLVPEAGQQDKMEVKIVKISGAQFVDGLLTETGNKPIDWLEVDEKGQSQLETTAADNFEQGHWVDVNSVVRPDGLGETIEGLRAALPEDISSEPV